MMRVENESRAPADLIRARCRAFGEGDFGFIYDSYHPDSYFRRQFPDRAAYLQHGKAVLGQDYSIDECRILREDSSGEEARIIFSLGVRYRGESTQSVELALLLCGEGGWRYHSSQKLTLDELDKPVDDVGFEDFERVRDKVFF